MSKRRNRKRSGRIAREDYRQGGRVGYQVGGAFEIEELERLRREQDRENNRQTLIDRPDVNGGGSKGQTEYNQNYGYTPSTTSTQSTTTETPTTTPFSGVAPAALSQAQLEREQRLQEAGARTAQIATGEIPLPETAQAQATLMGEKQPGETEEQFQARIAGTEIQPTEKLFMPSRDEISSEQFAIDADRQRKLDVAGPAEVVELPEEAKIQAAKIGADEIIKVPTEAIVETAQGNVSTEVTDALAKAAGVERVAPIEGAEVEIIPGALTERVIGTISPEAKAQAAVIGGTTLAKVTRAKKQLRNAGLSEADITELGNDPETLEARLMEFTEAERGIIEGLPEEALVSNQIDSLLKGIEEGKIPSWAAPAVASVEQMLAQRGMSASTVGRDALINTIIGAAIPIAQSNAQAIQASVSQQKSIEAQQNIRQAELNQQVAMQNANQVFQMDMAQFNADQQTALSNSKFLQTVSIQEANFDQQATVQNAALMAQLNIAEADQNTKLGIENARAFLQMDMANLSAEQQANVLTAQLEQQRVLSNQSAENARLQFNATSENQVNQFMANLSTNIALNNAQRMDAMAQFNTTQKNQAFAQQFQANIDADKFNSQLAAQVEQFNAQQQFARDQFNAQNSLVIEQSNVQWRRDITKADTAIQNQINMQNAQNSFAMSQAAQAQLWQELRDEFDYIFKASENAENRKTNIAVAGMQGGEGAAYKRDSWMNNLTKVINTFG